MVSEVTCNTSPYEGWYKGWKLSVGTQTVSDFRMLPIITGVRQQHYYQHRSEVSFNASEFTFTNDSTDRISVGDLVRGICHSTGIKSRLHSASEKNKSIQSPLPSVYTNEIQRSISYKKSSEKVEKWGAVVKHNREAMRMKFPIQEESTSLPSLSNKVETFEPLHHYEKLIAAEITRSDMHDNHHHESKLSEVNLKEVKQRRKELMKMRAQMSYLEAKRRRVKKIRSKRFHRVQRRHQSTKTTAVLHVPDIIEKAEKLRAKERMTLKHTSKAKWAKKQLPKMTKDSAIQQALSEHYQRKEKLMRNIESESDDSECAEFSQESCDNPWIETKERRMINTDGIHIRTSDYMQAGGFVINRDTEFGSFQANIHEAFSGDDVTQQFKEEKYLTSDAKKKVSKGALPGWGSWGGEGSKQKSSAFHRFQNKPSSSSLRDVNSEHVVLSELQDKKLAKHLVTAVPWPYTSLHQFEKSHCTPLGRHWNTEATFHRLITPQITKINGVRIEPLKLTDDIEDFIAVTQRAKHVVGK